MTKIWILNAQGHKHAEEEYTRLTGGRCYSTETISQDIEEKKARGDSLECEIASHKTLSKVPEFISFYDEHFLPVELD